MAGPCPRLNSDRGTLIINKSQESYSQWIPLGINLLGAAPTPSRAPPNSQGLKEGRGQHREMGVPWRPPCLGTPCTPQGGAADEGGRQRQEGDLPPRPQLHPTADQTGDRTTPPVPQLCPSQHHDGGPELPRCPWSPLCPPAVQGFKEGSDGQHRGSPLCPGGYRMMQGGRLLVIFSRGSPFRALRMASISWGDTAGEGSQAGLGSTWTHRGHSHGKKLPLSPLSLHPSRTCSGSWQGGRTGNSSRG